MTCCMAVISLDWWMDVVGAKVSMSLKLILALVVIILALTPAEVNYVCLRVYLTCDPLLASSSYHSVQLCLTPRHSYDLSSPCPHEPCNFRDHAQQA